MQCLVAKPIVDGIEKDLQGKAKVIRVNLLSKIGKEIAERYDVRSIPTLLIVKGDAVTYRHKGVPRRGHVVEQVSA
jgi:thiol-disulfide isomerase/thioredoxin